MTTTLPDDPFRGPWFDAKTAAAYVCSKNVRAFYEWRKRHGIVTRANGSVAKADLDRALKVPYKRRGPNSAAGRAAALANLEKSPTRQRAEAEVA